MAQAMASKKQRRVHGRYAHDWAAIGSGTEECQDCGKVRTWVPIMEGLKKEKVYANREDAAVNGHTDFFEGYAPADVK